MPCARGWRQDGVVAEAVRFREPCWLRRDSRGAAVPAAGSPEREAPIALGHPDLRLIALVADGGEGLLRLTVQNLSPCRHALDLGTAWQVLERLDGLGDPGLGASCLAEPHRDEAAMAGVTEGVVSLRPWQLASWRISRRGRRTDR
jgi:alpha-mannosidase